MFPRLCALILAASPAFMWGASREIQELQRDVALLQDQVKQLQQSQDKQLAALSVVVQQALDSANKANTALAVMQDGFRQSGTDLKNDVLPAVVGLSSRMDSVSNDMRTLQQAVSDLNSVVQKIQAQLTDIGNAMKVMQQPAAAPPPGPGGGAPPIASGQDSPGPSGPSSDTPSMPAKDLWVNATRDRTGGKLDLALQEFTDYLHWYGETDLAPNAQFYIGTIHYSQGAYDEALKNFDAVAEKFSDNPRTPDALYYKGLTLVKMSRRTDASAEFREVIQRFPAASVAQQACSQLTDMGLRCPAGKAPAKKSSSKR